MNDYLNLKKNVTTARLEKLETKDMPAPKCQKLWVKNLEISCIRDNIKKLLKNPEKQRCKTEER